MTDGAIKLSHSSQWRRRSATGFVTPFSLVAFHHEHGARYTCFGGYAVPACYEAGVLQEHLHTRAAASLFDLSRMGQLLILPRVGCRVRDIVLELETIMPLDVLGIEGRPAALRPYDHSRAPAKVVDVSQASEFAAAHSHSITCSVDGFFLK